jgi:energy-coupling factor transporter ATP-binding protein EcfA2
MRIKKLTLHRFKQFRDHEIEFRDGLSLVVGANNSGKSSILQALGTWQFCKTLLEIEKGREGWLETKTKAGIGMGIVDFTPLQIPSLKHLWTNLKPGKEGEPDGYTLKIGVHWQLQEGAERHLEIGLSLANDRLFVKTTSSSLKLADLVDEDGQQIEGNVPQIAYLPPFAGITDREALLTQAMRERMIGQGLSGGVIRNVLFDLHEANKSKRAILGMGRPKIKTSDLRELRKSDPWEILLKAVQATFGTDLRFKPFNERYHSYLRLECVKGKLNGTAFKKYPGYSSRDLMVEGSGFLQWLSVFALSLSPEIDLVLLDEPDAHLNAALQKELVSALADMIQVGSKQVLLATHSPELIRVFDHERIIAVRGQKATYLGDSSGKISVLAGIGTTHTPKLHELTEKKRMLILEGESDERFLKTIASRHGLGWPKNVVSWFWPGKASERLQLFIQLRKEIPELRAISIRDRDDEPGSTVGKDLVDRGFTCKEAGFKALKWRRRHIENYLLSSAAIARSADKDEADVQTFFQDTFGLALPKDNTPSDILQAIKDAHGKEIFTKGASLKSEYSISRDDVAASLTKHEVPEDMKMFFDALFDLAA